MTLEFVCPKCQKKYPTELPHRTHCDCGEYLFVPNSTANQVQFGGTHYKQSDGGEEHWDRVARLGLDYFQAAATKYIERWRLKNGIEDLKKARHYLDKYIELIEAGVIKK